MMFAGSRRRMFRNETPATKKPSLTRQAIGILASSRELMDEVQPARMAMQSGSLADRQLFQQATNYIDQQLANRRVAGSPAGILREFGSDRENLINEVYQSLLGGAQLPVSNTTTRSRVPSLSQTSQLDPVDVGALTQSPSARLRIPQVSNTGMGIGALPEVQMRRLSPDPATMTPREAFVDPTLAAGNIRSRIMGTNTVERPDRPRILREQEQVVPPEGASSFGIATLEALENMKPAGVEGARGTELFKTGTAINAALVPKTAEEKAAEYSESTRSADQRFARDLKGKQGQVTRLEKREESLKAKLSKALINNNKKAEQTYRLQLTELEGNLKKARNELSVLEDVQGQKSETKVGELVERLEELRNNPDVSPEDLLAFEKRIQEEMGKTRETREPGPRSEPEEGFDPSKLEPALPKNAEEMLKKAEERANATLEDAVNASGADPDDRDPLLEQVRKLKDDLKSGSEGIADGTSTEEQDIVRRAMEMAEYDEQEIRDSLKKDSFWNAVMMFGLQMAAGASEGGDRFSNMARAAVIGLNEFNKDMKEKEKSAYARYRDKKADAFTEAGLELKRLAGERQALQLQNTAASTAASLANIESSIADRKDRRAQADRTFNLSVIRAIDEAVTGVFDRDNRGRRDLFEDRYIEQNKLPKDTKVPDSKLEPFVRDYYRDQYGGSSSPKVISLD